MSFLPTTLLRQLNDSILASYPALTARLISTGFHRVERDDRLLDIFPDQTREKGVELWDRWQPSTILIVRLRLPYNPRQIKICSLSRDKLEQALINHQTLNLSHFYTSGV